MYIVRLCCRLDIQAGGGFQLSPLWYRLCRDHETPRLTSKKLGRGLDYQFLPKSTKNTSVLRLECSVKARSKNTVETNQRPSSHIMLPYCDNCDVMIEISCNNKGMANVMKVNTLIVLLRIPVDG